MNLGLEKHSRLEKYPNTLSCILFKFANIKLKSKQFDGIKYIQSRHNIFPYWRNARQKQNQILLYTVIILPVTTFAYLKWWFKIWKPFCPLPKILRISYTILVLVLLLTLLFLALLFDNYPVWREQTRQIYTAIIYAGFIYEVCLPALLHSL